MTSAARETLVLRIRQLLRGEPSLREVRMFGGLSFMVNDQMVVAAGRSGDLLVHVDPARSDELLSRPGARQAQMGKGRSMGPAWLEVDFGVLDDVALDQWLQTALSFNRSGREQ